MNVKANLQDDKSLDGRFYYSVENEDGVQKLLIIHVMGSSVLFFEFWKNEDNNQISNSNSFEHGGINTIAGLEEEIRESNFIQNQNIINSITNYIQNQEINQTLRNFINSKI